MRDSTFLSDFLSKRYPFIKLNSDYFNLYSYIKLVILPLNF